MGLRPLREGRRESGVLVAPLSALKCHHLGTPAGPGLYGGQGSGVRQGLSVGLQGGHERL